MIESNEQVHLLEVGYRTDHCLFYMF
jgi:hypothetical protein